MLDLHPPKTTIQQRLVSRVECRLSVLTEILTHMGASDATIRIAQAGLADGTMNRVIIKGLDAYEYTREQASLWFDELAKDDQISVDLSNGRSMTEAVSTKLARAVEYSVACMKRKGLTPAYRFGFKPAIANDTTAFQSALDRYGLVSAPDRGLPPGMAMRQVFSVTPGKDSGMHYAHASAYHTK